MACITKTPPPSPVSQKFVKFSRLERQQKDFLKLISNLHIALSFLFMGLKRQIRPCTPKLPRKPYQNSDQDHKVFTRFQTKKPKKPYLLGRHIPIRQILGI